MNRRSFIKALAAGILGVPLLKPNPPKPETFRSATSVLWLDDQAHVFIPNWFPDGKGAWLKTLNGFQQEFNRELAKMVPEEHGAKT